MTSAALVFAQVSDLHLSDLATVRFGQLLNKRLLGYLSWRRRRRHEHSREVLAALRQDLIAGKPDQLLVCGDLTHIGLPDEFAQVRHWLDQLPLQSISLVPGNHDSYVAEPWSNCYSQWAPYMGSDDSPSPTSLEQAYPSLTVRDGVAFIGLSSAEPTAPFFATGRLGERQLQRLAELLEQSGRQGLFRVVYLHHPPLPGTEKWRKRLRDAAALTELLESCGAELLLYGHSHRRQLLSCRAAGREIPVIGIASASALGYHGETACYNLFRVLPGSQGWLLEVENRLFSAAQGGFLSSEKSSLRIAAPVVA